MANKKLFYLFAGYITGTIIASLYSNKNGDTVRKEMEEGKGKGEFEDKKVLLDHILDLHKRLITEISHDKNVQKTADVFSGYKDTFQKFFDTSKSEIVGILKEYKGLGEKDIQDISSKLQGFVKDKFESGISSLKSTLAKREDLKPRKSPSKKPVSTKKTPGKKAVSSKKKSS